MCHGEHVRVWGLEVHHGECETVSDLFPSSTVSQNFKLDKNRVQRFGYQVTLFTLNTFLEIEQKPALATLKKESLIIEAGRKK